MWFQCLGLICDLIGVGFGGVGLICDLWLWVCFVVFYGLFYGGCGFVGGGYAVLALDCVFFFFFLVQLLGFMVVADGLIVGWCLWLRQSGF